MPIGKKENGWKKCNFANRVEMLHEAEVAKSKAGVVRERITSKPNQVSSLVGFTAKVVSVLESNFGILEGGAENRIGWVPPSRLART